MHAAEVNYSAGRQSELIRSMIAQHNGTVISHGSYVIEAWFVDEDDRDRFELELAAYNDQQDFLELWQYSDLLVKGEEPEYYQGWGDMESIARAYELWNLNEDRKHEAELDRSEDDWWCGDNQDLDSDPYDIEPLQF